MILLKDCLRVLRPHGEDLSGVDILIEGNRITRIAKGIEAPKAQPGAKRAEVVDASRLVCAPGLVNTHHHFYQTLTRNVPAVQDAKLFDWLVYLYEVWKGIDEEAVYWSSMLALAELAKTGCTLTTDHHYLYPRGFGADIPSLQFEAASRLGLRFAPTRGSMSRSKKDGGLPPDSVVQDEDEILAHCEATIDKYHDPAEGAMRKVSLAPCSPFSVSERSMRDAADLARRKGVRLHTHLAETADENDFCLQALGRRPLQVMEDCGFVGSDVWYAHGIHFNDEELDLLARTKTGVAHCPSSNMRLGSGIARVSEMLDLGIPVGLGGRRIGLERQHPTCSERRGRLCCCSACAAASAGDSRPGAGGMKASEALSIATEGGARLLGYEKTWPHRGRIPRRPRPLRRA